ncbi:MAG: glycosyltransferase family 4 protein [Desulfobulbaceae bacterium]|nr:glycosyltransferase family 4 protein [Desulfobulbaceae bacterium]
MKILSPMATGNGAYIVHRSLAERIDGYTLTGYNPYWSLCPPTLPSLFRDQKADIIHTVPEYGYFLKRNHIPLVVTFHSFVVDRETAQFSTFLQKIHHRTNLHFFIRKALSVADKVTSVSHFTAGMIRREFGYQGEIPVIYNGVDTEKFRPAKKSASHKITVLFSGNLTKRKGAHLLPKIASLLNEKIEILYTSGLRDKNPLPDLPNMRNIGHIPFSQMPAVYQQADILLFPSVREGFGLAAAEAMACGLPVVATNCSSLPELVVDGQGGYLCELGNTEEFAGRINELAESPLMRRDMGDFNRIRVEKNFTLAQMVAGYLNLFREVHKS